MSSAGPLFDGVDGPEALAFCQVPERDVLDLAGDLPAAAAALFLRAWVRGMTRARRPEAWAGWPTDPVAALVRWTRVDETTVRRILRRLEAAGVVRRTKGSKHGPGAVQLVRSVPTRAAIELAEARARANAEAPRDQRADMPVENGSQRAGVPAQRAAVPVDTYLGLHTRHSPPPPMPSPTGAGEGDAGGAPPPLAAAAPPKAVRRSSRRASPGPLPTPAAGPAVTPATACASPGSAAASQPTRTEPGVMGDPSPSDGRGDAGGAPLSVARWATDPAFRAELAERYGTKSPELAALLRRTAPRPKAAGA